MSERSRRQRKNVYFMGVLLIAAFMAGIPVWFYFMKKDTTYRDKDFFDPAAETGILSNMTEREIQSELDWGVDEGMLDISIASGITFENSKAMGQADIYNSKANSYIIKAVITLDDTGEKVYESKKIKPGAKIQYIKLDKRLGAGEYPATAMFSAYSQDNFQIVGVVGTHIMLYIEQ
jgi:hypothetical protein